MKKKMPTQKEISKILKVSQPTVSKYANRILSLSWEQGQILKKQLQLTDNDINFFISKNIQPENKDIKYEANSRF